MEFQLLIRRYRILPMLLLIGGLAACEKDITVDLPQTEARIVVEGSIENGQPPIVLLTRTQGFFAPTSIESIASSFISEATVQVSDGVNTYVLDKICSSMLPDSLLEEAALLTGFEVGLLANANICIWTSLSDLVGEVGTTYRLDVQVEDVSLSSTTTIPHPVPLDSLWFRLAQERPGDDSLGYIWATLSDPDTLGNTYRWYTKRLNRNAEGGTRDARFVAPLFGVFEDRYLNGISGLTLNFYRGREPFEDENEPDEERGYFKRNDTVAFKLASMGQTEYDFFYSYANNVSTDGDVFSTPANIRSNIDGGLGIWVGYGAAVDTVICIP